MRSAYRAASLGIGFRYPFEMDVSVKIIPFPQKFYRSDELFHREIGRDVYGGGEKQPFDIVALVKVHGQLADLLRRGARTRDVVASAAHAVLAVEDTVVAQQDFQQGNASSVRRKRMTAPVRHSVSDPAFVLPSAARRGAGHVIFCTLREDVKGCLRNHGFSIARPLG